MGEDDKPGIRRVRIDREIVSVDVGHQPSLSLRDARGGELTAYLVRFGEGNPFAGGRQLQWEDSQLFFVVESDPEDRVRDCPALSNVRFGTTLWGPQGIGVRLIGSDDLVLRDGKGGFYLNIDANMRQAMTLHVEAEESGRLLAWLPFALGEQVAAPGPALRLSALA